MRQRPLLLSLLLCLPACAWYSHEHVLVTSDPLGAAILVDGEDTGYTTPRRIAIGGNFGRDHTVLLRKKGYRPTARRVYQYTEGYTSKIIDGAFDLVMDPSPFFWTTGDLLLPLGIRGAILPAELHVQLEREDAPLLGFDLLAERERVKQTAAAADQRP